MKKKVFVNGCFDILHVGHVELLQFAKSLGDYLIVALNSDESVRSSKPGRPIFTLEDRMKMIAALKSVDDVVGFDSPKELEQLVEVIQPDFMVVGSDWKGKKIVGGEFAKQVVFFDRIPEYSTTGIIDEVRNRY